MNIWHFWYSNDKLNLLTTISLWSKEILDLIWFHLYFHCIFITLHFILTTYFILPYMLKPMDSYRANFFNFILCFVNAEIHGVVWTVNDLLIIRSEMFPLKHFAIGYVHTDNLSLGNIALQYVIKNNCRKIWWCFLMIPFISWRSRKKFLNSPKLSCGFKCKGETYKIMPC